MKTFFGALSCALLLAGLAMAQSGNATVTGTVVDASEAVIPGAKIIITNKNTGVAKTSITTAAGLYFVPDLPPGTYTIDVSANGFEAKKYADVRLDVDQQAKINVTLTVGSEKQSVTVGAESAPLLQTVEASVGTVVNSQSVVDLPLNGRYFTQLLELSPGTVPATHDLASGLNKGVERNGMPAFGVNGQSAALTNFRIDGIENEEREFGGANLPVSVDAIEEFKLQTADFSAEYGRSPAQVDIVTKSGTNQIHGSAFEFVRNQIFDATQWSYTGPHAPPLLKRNQFGGTLGGPIKRNKLFFFYDYDGTREKYSSPETVTVPTNLERSGVFPAGNPIFDPTTGLEFPNNTIPSNRFDPISTKILALLPAPNLPGVSDYNALGQLIGVTNNYLFVPTHSTTINQNNIRGDYVISDHDTVNARYTYSSNDQVGYGPLATNVQNSLIYGDIANLGGQNLSGSYYHNFTSTTINEFRAGFNTDPQSYLKTDNTDFRTELGLQNVLPANGDPGLPGINIGSSLTLSSGEARPLVTGEHNYEIVDNVTLIRGAHSIRIGVSTRRTYLTTLNGNFSDGVFSFNGAQTRQRGTTTYNGQTVNLGATGDTACPGSSNPTSCTAGNAYADFLLGYLSTYLVNAPVPTTHKYQGSYGEYVNDVWRIRPNLTINIGLRYDYQERPTAQPAAYAQPQLVNGQFTGVVGIAQQGSALSPRLLPQALTLTPGVFVGCTTIGLPASCLISEKNDWQPRVGFAYQPMSKTVIRAGAGIFYGYWGGDQETEVGTNQYPFTFATSSPTYTAPPTGSAAPPLIWSQLGTANASTPTLGASAPNRRLPQTYQWNFTVEQQLPGSVTVSGAYVGVLGRHLADNQNSSCCVYNVPAPVGVVLAPGQTQAVPDPLFGTVSVHQGENSSSYQSLQLKATKRFSHGFTGTAAYTYSKLLGTIVGLSQPLYPFLDRGPLPSDLRNVLVLSSVWEIPVGNGRQFLNHSGFLNYLIGGWQVNEIISLHSGFSFTPTLVGTDLLNQHGYNTSEDRPNRVCNGALSDPTVNNWFNKSCFVLPTEPTTPGALLVEGNSGVGILYGPGAFNMDAGLAKEFPIKERFIFQFRAEAFNITNHPSLGLPDATINPSAAANTPARITSVISSPRTMQLALKLRF